MKRRQKAKEAKKSMHNLLLDKIKMGKMVGGTHTPLAERVAHPLPSR